MHEEERPVAVSSATHCRSRLAFPRCEQRRLVTPGFSPTPPPPRRSEPLALPPVPLRPRTIFPPSLLYLLSFSRAFYFELPSRCRLLVILKNPLTLPSVLRVSVSRLDFPTQLPDDTFFHLTSPHRAHPPTPCQPSSSSIYDSRLIPSGGGTDHVLPLVSLFVVGHKSWPRAKCSNLSYRQNCSLQFSNFGSRVSHRRT